MIVRHQIRSEFIEIVTAERDGFETALTTRRAEFVEPAYAQILDEIQQADANGDWTEFQETLGLPEAGVAPFQIDLSDWPEGTVMRLWNEARDPFDYTDPAVPLTLTDSGRYTVQIAPPLPYHTITVDMVLTDA